MSQAAADSCGDRDSEVMPKISTTGESTHTNLRQALQSKILLVLRQIHQTINSMSWETEYVMYKRKNSLFDNSRCDYNKLMTGLDIVKFDTNSFDPIRKLMRSYVNDQLDNIIKEAEAITNEPTYKQQQLQNLEGIMQCLHVLIMLFNVEISGEFKPYDEDVNVEILRICNIISVNQDLLESKDCLELNISKLLKVLCVASPASPNSPTSVSGGGGGGGPAKEDSKFPPPTKQMSSTLPPNYNLPQLQLIMQFITSQREDGISLTDSNVKKSALVKFCIYYYYDCCSKNNLNLEGALDALPLYQSAPHYETSISKKKMTQKRKKKANILVDNLAWLVLSFYDKEVLMGGLSKFKFAKRSENEIFYPDNTIRNDLAEVEVGYDFKKG
jgi:hypothetical protein